MFKERQEIRINGFSGKAHLIYQNNIFHDYQVKKTEKEYFLIQKAHQIHLFYGYYKHSEILKIYLLSLDWDILNLKKEDNHISSVIEHEWIQELKIILQEDSSDEKLIEFTKSKHTRFSYCHLEISRFYQDRNLDNDVYQIAHYYSAGYPPLILIFEGNFQFPVRSGIPLGITDIYPKKQTLEIPIQSKIYIHTPINEKKHNLRELHYNLVKNEFENFSHDLLLFEYQFLDYEST